MSVRLILRSSSEFVRDRARRWNLFNTRSSDPLIIRQEILSTRLYIILVMISLIILTTYTTISNRIENKTVTFPSQSLYEKLQKKYSDSLECSCTKVSIPHGKFVRIIPKFHQVCSTDFVSQKWIDFIFKVDVELIMPIDVRTSMSAMWQLIRSFCQSAINTTIDTLDEFENSPWVNPILVTEKILDVEVQMTLNLLRQTTASNFLQSITFVHKMARANQLITGLLTNYISTTSTGGLLPHRACAPQTDMYGNNYIQKGSMRSYSCKDDDSCPSPGNLYLYENNMKKKHENYNLNQIEANASLSGIIIDCLPVQSTFLSSLECFYNQSCLNILLSAYETKINIPVLNQSLTSRFSLKTTIESLVRELFIEEIFNKTIYSEYYSECLPYICTYVYFHRFNWISVMTVIIAIFGGITAVLSIIAPLIVQLVLFIKKRFFSKESAPEQVAQDQNETIQTRLKKLFNTIKIKIINLNLYDTNSRDATRIYHEILSTRLYLFSLFISINIYILYVDFSNQTVTEKILNPFQYDYENLIKRYSSTVICPCTEISIPYEDIINITVDYHQICKSHFIQSSWYDRFSLANIGLWSSYSNIDSVSIAVSYFRILETFCSLANETINDAKERFLTRNLINSQLLTSNLFYSQINSSIDTFKQSTKTEFLDRANLTNVLLHSNQYLSRTITNTRLRSINQNITGLLSIKMLIFALYIVNTNNDKCYCVIDSTCHLNLSIRDECETYNIVWPIEGINLGCSIIDTVMQSSLICWFNKSCIYELRRRVEKYNISVHENSTILLDRNLSSRYYPNTPIEEIFNEMMIEEWNIFRSFASYFLKCKPLLCSVTYQKKANIIYIITVIIGLIGGINVILNLISPLIIKIIFKIINKLRRQRSLQNQSEEQDNNYQNDEICNNAVCNLMKRLINRLLLLNLFDDESTHIETIRRQRISTRVYIVVLSISMCIIAMYTMFSDRHKPQLFLNPSQNDYNRLLTSYSESLKCPCKNISIEYKHFIQINTTFHAVCSSDFISKRWHDYLFGRANWYYYDRRDIRVRGASYFLFLSKLCQISQTTINNALNQFLNTTFINTHMISISEFDSQINDIISQFKNNTLIIFSRRLKLFRDILNGNAFVSSYSLNWYFYREYNSTSDINPIQPVKMTNKCSCGTRSDCIDPGGVYDTLNNTAKFLIPGWNVGCSVVETLLHSTFECLYDQICLNSLLSNTEQYTFEHSHYINISAMSFLNHSHFKPNTTIQNIADELFVEEWNNITSYSSFYKQCNPQECSYKIERDNYFASISSNILGLYGGLTVVLRFSIPFVIEIIFKIRNRCRRNTVVPTE